MVNKMVPDGASPPNYISEPLPKLADVPVAQMRGNGMMIAMPLAAGDFGMLVFAERNMSAYRSTGQQSDPGDLGLHTMSSAYFVPAVAPDSKALSSADGTNLVIGSDTNHAARLVIKPSGEIDAGANATNFVAMADKVLTELGKISTAIANSVAHTHAYLPGPGVSTPTGPAVGFGSYSASAVASTNLKAEE